MPSATLVSGCQRILGKQMICWVAGACYLIRFIVPRQPTNGIDMGQLRLEGDPPITIDLRPNARSRRLSLRVSRLDGRVSMSLPKWTGQGEAMEFAREKETWIRGQLAGCHDCVVAQVGGTVLFEGFEVPVAAGAGRSAVFRDGILLVPGDASRVPARVEAFLKIMARQRLVGACDRYSGLVGRPYSGISLRDTRSRWGSCSAEGKLMFSWRLVMAPTPVLDYVAAHEVAHLVEMNHSPAFWRVVSDICPNYREWRGWLRANGGRLHAYRFRN